jgi:FkbH-like protein
MFETDKYDRKLHREPPAQPEVKYQHLENMDGMSFLLWAEHCVECAAPACYSSCDLYEPRSDWRCRRFAFGAYKNPAFASARGYGVEVRFKKWAKLETFANSAIYPLQSVLRLERLLERATHIGNRIGTVAHHVGGGSNLEQLTYISLGKLSRSLNRRRTRRHPEAFLLEVYNPEASEVHLQVIFSVSVDDLHNGAAQGASAAPAITTVVLPPGYSHHRFEPALFRQFLDRQLPFKITMIPEAESNARLVFLTADFVTFRPAATQDSTTPGLAPFKCVVWDLDNTLWNGTLIEGDEVTLRPGIGEMLKYFDERGILMSIASKNDAESALARLKEFKLEEYFLYPQIDWSPKSIKISKIARQLNIGLDAVAFVDDNSFELAEVSQALPQITCVDAGTLEQAILSPRFQGNVTKESRQRRHYYQQQIAREIEQTAFAGDYTGFLKTCKIVLQIAPYQSADAERIAELVQRTNQLNFSGHKYSRAQLDQLIEEPAFDKYVLRCSDRYGAYGTVGFCIVQQEQKELRINDFMLSCRVQGKFIEQALFSHLLEHHNLHGTRAIWVNFRVTDRNTPARQVLESLGFEHCDAEDGTGRGGLMLRQSNRLSCDFITVNCGVDIDAVPLAKAVLKSF